MFQLEEKADHKTYKAFSGPIAWAVYLPWFTPILISAVVLVKQQASGYHGHATLLLTLFVILLSMIPIAIVGQMAAFTSVTIGPLGIRHEGVTLEQNINYLIPFRIKQKKIEANWNEIYEIGGSIGQTMKPIFNLPTSAAVKERIYIRTKAGDIIFGVMFNPQANMEIINQILFRAPHLKSKD